MAALPCNPVRRSATTRFSARWGTELSHPNIVTIHSVDEADGVHFLTLELVEGGTLEALTDEGKVLGTVAYMSPEQAEGKALDHRTDIFSLGGMLYEMATGQRPFTGDTQLSAMASIVRDTPRPVTSDAGPPVSDGAGPAQRSRGPAA